MRKLVFQLLVCMLFISCVSNKEFAKLKEELNDKEKAQASLAVKLTEAIKENSENKMALAALKKAYRQWLKDSSSVTKSYQKALSNLEEYKSSNKTLKDNYDELLSHSGDKNQKLIRQLAEKEQALNEQQSKLLELETALGVRGARVEELEGIIKQQELRVGNLKEKINEALVGFDDSQLSVELKDGKVYVSLSNKLLFKSGSISVDPKGVEALKKLAKALSGNKDINIMIEGHTDSDKFLAKTSMKDNWDLSVLRATSIVRVLVEEVDPKRIICAGRGEFMPIAGNDTPENKGKNRRTEIILTPDLSELFEILEAN